MRRSAFARTKRSEPGEIVVTYGPAKHFFVKVDHSLTVDRALDCAVSRTPGPVGKQFAPRA